MDLSFRSPFFFKLDLKVELEMLKVINETHYRRTGLSILSYLNYSKLSLHIFLHSSEALQAAGFRAAAPAGG